MWHVGGKVVLITGASRGLGRVLAEVFAEHGAHLILCARRADVLADVEADLARRGVAAMAEGCDVSVEEDVLRLVHRGVQRFGRVVKDHRLAVQFNLAGIRRQHAAQDVHERGFSGAVLAQQGANFTAPDRKGHVFEHHVGAEGFPDAAHFNNHGLPSNLSSQLIIRIFQGRGYGNAIASSLALHGSCLSWKVTV